MTATTFLLCIFGYVQAACFTWIYYIQRHKNDLKNDGYYYTYDSDGFILGIFWPFYWNYRIIKAIVGLINKEAP